MYIKLDEELKEKIEKITDVDYDFKGEYMPSESIEPMLKDLIYEIDKLEEKINDIQQDIENNYELKKYDPYEEYGLSERDFIEEL